MLTATAKRVNGFPGIHLACLVLVPLPVCGWADWRIACPVLASLFPVNPVAWPPHPETMPGWPLRLLHPEKPLRHASRRIGDYSGTGQS